MDEDYEEFGDRDVRPVPNPHRCRASNPPCQLVRRGRLDVSLLWIAKGSVYCSDTVGWFECSGHHSLPSITFLQAAGTSLPTRHSTCHSAILLRLAHCPPAPRPCLIAEAHTLALRALPGGRSRGQAGCGRARGSRDCGVICALGVGEFRRLVMARGRPGYAEMRPALPPSGCDAQAIFSSRRCPIKCPSTVGARLCPGLPKKIC